MFPNLLKGSFPDFLIIGAQRCGTTQLFQSFAQHPQFIKPSRKEIHFFDIFENYRRGIDWYCGQFPSALKRWKYSLKRAVTMISGEASPYYFFNPLAAKRIFEALPKMKLILLLRNPVDRAYSQYHHEFKIGFESSRNFEEALSLEEQRLKGEAEKISNAGNYDGLDHRHHSYFSRGIYADQLARWKKYFPEERILILKSEDFFENPQKEFDKVCLFLKITPHKIQNKTIFNLGGYPPMQKQTREKLARLFAPHNQRLYALLSRNFGWEASAE